MTLSARLRATPADCFSSLRAAIHEKKPGSAWSLSYQEHSSGASYLLVRLANPETGANIAHLAAETAEEAAAMVRADRWVRES